MIACVLGSRSQPATNRPAASATGMTAATTTERQAWGIFADYAPADASSPLDSAPSTDPTGSDPKKLGRPQALEEASRRLPLHRETRVGTVGPRRSCTGTGRGR